MSLSQQLKEQTLANHQALEKKVIGSLKAMASVKDYAAILEKFYIFFSAVEKQTDEYINDSMLPDYPERRKSSALKFDLEQLGFPSVAKADPDDTHYIHNHLHALGAMYVMEGSTLGGQHIARMIRTRLNQDTKPSCTFFESYGDRLASMWETFKNSIDELPLTAVAHQVVIAAADDTFKRFEKYFSSEIFKPV